MSTKTDPGRRPKRPSRGRSRPPKEDLSRFDEPSQRSAGGELLQMMGLVAVVVALVILVFFGLGYLFGRLFL